MTVIALKTLFWVGVFLLSYTYLGYGALLYGLIRLKGKQRKALPLLPEDSLPEVTFMIPAYNEAEWIREKIENTLLLDYPHDKFHLFFVTDGCSDETPEIIRDYPFPDTLRVQLFHDEERRGKIAAVERVMPFVKTPITIYTDANTMVNPEAVQQIVKHYADPKVGAVAGEKRIHMQDTGDASASGEGFYWKYESTLKKWDALLYSVVGAAGELFSIRTDLFESVPSDTLIEDFVMTLGIARKGYKVAYEPGAYAVEGHSASVGEELKRKIRIAAGGLQAVWRLRPLLNPFRYRWLSFQYISHRVLRWTLAPLFLPVVFMTNILLAWQGLPFFQVLLLLQCLFFLFAFTGFLLQQKQLKIKAFFIPFYFCVMNYAVYMGLVRLIKGSQSVLWEKAKRAKV